MRRIFKTMFFKVHQKLPWIWITNDPEVKKKPTELQNEVGKCSLGRICTKTDTRRFLTSRSLEQAKKLLQIWIKNDPRIWRTKYLRNKYKKSLFKHFTKKIRGFLKPSLSVQTKTTLNLGHKRPRSIRKPKELE